MEDETNVVHDIRDRSRSRERDENLQYDDQERRHSDTQDIGGWGDRQDEPLASSRSNALSSSSANLYITNLSFKTTEDSLRAAFEGFGQIDSIQVVKDPLTGNSRGFGFINFVESADGERAVEKMHEAVVDDRNIRVEKARRATGYAKTPGKYMGPPQVAAKFGRDGPGGGRDYDRRDVRGPPPSGRGGDRGGFRSSPPGGRGGFRGDRYSDYPRDDYPRRDPPPRYDDRRGPPDRYGSASTSDRHGYGDHRVTGDHRYASDRYDGGRDDYARRDPPPRYDDRRGPPPMAPRGVREDRRMPTVDREPPRGAPPGDHRRGPPPADRGFAYSAGPGAGPADRHGGGRY